MNFISYAFLCIFIGLYLYFQFNNQPLPAYFDQARVWVAWGLLLWAGFSAGRVIVSCISLGAKGEMTAEHIRSGMLLGVLHGLPAMLMAIFLLRSGFVTK